MDIQNKTRSAFLLGIVAALLAGCNGLTTVSATPAVAQSVGEVPATLQHHRTFHYTGNAQSFKVPAGVKWITVVALGAAGGGSLQGHGGRVYAQLPVSDVERLRVFVGGAAHGANGGYNGGGNGFFYSSIQSYGGGGASDVRIGDTLRDRVLVAGGGGGEGGENDDNHGMGGKGGGSTAGDGSHGTGGRTEYGHGHTYGKGGTGGTQDSGGSGGAAGGGGYGYGLDGANGSFGIAGAGGEGQGGSGGGAGGGYYGGGGGGGGGWDYGDYEGGGGGGGGGSSYVEPGARKFESWKGWKTASGNGLVVFSWQ